MKSARNKHGPSFKVVVFNHGKQSVKETDDAHEAYSLAHGHPDLVIEKFNESGSIEDSAYFSPKHSLWSRNNFIKWALSRGRNASRLIRQRIDK